MSLTRRTCLVAVLVAALQLSAAGHAQEADDCPNPKGFQPSASETQKILRAHGNWLKRDGPTNPKNPGRAILCNVELHKNELRSAKLKWADLRGADLRGADLAYANLSRASLRNAMLHEADLSGAVLEGTDLTGAKLSKTDLMDTDLKNAFLYSADLTGARLIRTRFDGSKLTGATLTRALYEPASAPSKGHLSGLRGLETVRFRRGEHSGLAQLRAALQEVGLRGLEREATFAIESRKTDFLLGMEIKNGVDYWSPLLDRLEKDPNSVFIGTLRLVFFELTTGYGLHNVRPIWPLLLALIGILTIVYVIPIAIHPRTESGIYRVWPRERVEVTKNGPKVCGDTQVERLRLERWNVGGVLSILGNALWFSLLSTFHIGWRDLNVGSWLSRIQPREYVLRPKGWVRVVSGLQSLVSVYLIAMWALTTFARPFQ